MIWMFLILALSTVAVSLVGLAAYLRVRSHMKDVLPERPRRQRLTRTRYQSPAVQIPTRRTSNMAKPATLVLDRGGRALHWAEQAVIVVSASLFVALCARVTIPLPFTPVPLTLQNFGVLLVGLTLGSRRGFAALALYLVEGAAGYAGL